MADLSISGVEEPQFSTFHEPTTEVDLSGEIHMGGPLDDDEEDDGTLDEPVMDTLKRDMAAIGKKFNHVIFPRESRTLMRDWDLWGPLILCIVLALLLQGHDIDDHTEGGPQFSEVFVIVWLGATVVTWNSKLLGGHISFFQSVCVLGYCLLPMTVGCLLCEIIRKVGGTSTAVFIVRSIIVLLSLVWSTYASIKFLGDSQPRNRKALTVYPICLFYFVISWLIISHNG